MGSRAHTKYFFFSFSNFKIFKSLFFLPASRLYQSSCTHEIPVVENQQEGIDIFFYIEIKKNIKGVKIIIFPWYVWGIVNIFLKKISWKYHSNDTSFLLSLNSDNITFPSCLGRIEINMIPPKM